jgi:hypothetical protein
MAQVYSVNAVGYVNVSLAPGFNLVANQFTASSYAVSNILVSAPLGATVFVFVNNNYQTSILDEFGSGWSNPMLQLPLGGGFFIQNPGGATTLTMVGEVPQGTLTTSIPAGYSIRSSQVPQMGTVADLGLVAGGGDVIFRFSATTQNYSQFVNDEFGSGWSSPTGSPVDPVEGPTVNVGEAFWYNAVAPLSWARTFTVN